MALRVKAALLTSATRALRRLHIPALTNGASNNHSKMNVKREWLVVLPDQDGAAERRAKHRSEHLAQLSRYPSDFFLWGGPYLRKPTEDGKEMEMLGSVLLAWATCPKEVSNELKKDVFTKYGVWDWRKAQILPFKSTLRKAL